MTDPFTDPALHSALDAAADPVHARSVLTPLLEEHPELFDLMRSVNETTQTTFLIVTHDPRLAQRCDRILELVDGRIVSDRPNANVVRRSA